MESVMIENRPAPVACGENLTWGSTYEGHCIEQGWQTTFFFKHFHATPPLIYFQLRNLFHILFSKSQ